MNGSKLTERLEQTQHEYDKVKSECARLYLKMMVNSARSEIIEYRIMQETLANLAHDICIINELIESGE